MYQGPNGIHAALQRVSSGDLEAYTVIVEAYQAHLRGFIARYAPHAEWVDDVAQQAFVTAYQELADFRPGTDFYAWLRRIAYNRLQRELERATRRHRLRQDYLAELSTRELASRLDREGKDEPDALVALRACVQRLPEKARSLLERYYTEGVPLQKIATKLGRSEGGLKVTLFKIRAKLKTCIQERQARAISGLEGV